MKLDELRVSYTRGRANGWERSIRRIREAIELLPKVPRAVRVQYGLVWFDSALLLGAKAVAEPHEILLPVFEKQCEISPPPNQLTTGEIALASHANLFACCGYSDYTHYFKDRLYDVDADRNDYLAYWYFAKAFAGIALREKSLYRGPSGTEAGWDEPMPFTAGELHGRNPQSLMAHLAGAVETGATIDDVWPAFEECVHLFPSRDATNEFDGAVLFWIARIVYHQIGGQPLGQTADWLSRHFNAWADGRSLPPLG
jgi:hypothetical protein